MQSLRMEYEESDIAWDLLKSFSLLSVKEGKGSVHRLLQQSMRSCQSNDESRCNLIICIDALRSLWTFKTETVVVKKCFKYWSMSSVLSLMLWR